MINSNRRGERSALRPGRSLPPEKSGAHCTGGWVGPRTGLDRCGKSRLPPGFDPRTVQLVASRYTDWAIGPTHLWMAFNFSSLLRNLWPHTCWINTLRDYVGKQWHFNRQNISAVCNVVMTFYFIMLTQGTLLIWHDSYVILLFVTTTNCQQTEHV
jgi:hypothetical protein